MHVDEAGRNDLPLRVECCFRRPSCFADCSNSTAAESNRAFVKGCPCSVGNGGVLNQYIERLADSRSRQAKENTKD
jgi:hypothetical protein